MNTKRIDSRKLIMVLGMHRSGTSAMTHMLSSLGANPGQELLEAQAGVNEQGFWEHKELVDINEAILSQLGTHWYDFRPLPEKWWKQKSLGSLRARARQFLDTAFGDSELAVIKDPRLCILLPFWEPLVRKSGWQPSALMATRAPWEVVASLCRRDPLDESTANLLWLRYQHGAEIHSRNLPRCVMDYQELLTDWRIQATQVAQQLGIEWPADRDEVDPVIDAAIDPSLRHQATKFKSSDIKISSLATRVYHLLQGPVIDLQKLDASWQEFESLFSTCDVMGDTVSAGNARLIDINIRLQMLGNDHQQALDTLKERDEQLALLNKKVLALGRVHHEALKMVEVRDAQLSEVNDELKALGEQHQHAQQVVRDRDDQLQSSNQQLQELGQEHKDALTVLTERDKQLKQINQQLQQLGKEHKDALTVLTERDGQQKQLSQQLQQLGSEHEHAITVVQERDAQLEQRNAEYDQLGVEYQQLNDKYQKLRTHPMVKGLVKLLSLEDK